MVLPGHPWVSPIYSTFSNSVADLFCDKLRTFAVHSGNVKNMCFLNAILQCFYHTPMLRRNLSLACESQKPSPKLHHSAQSSLPSFGHHVVANLWSFEFLWGAVVKDQWLIQLHQLFTQMDESRRSQNLIAATEMASLIQAASTNGTLAEMKEGSQQLVDRYVWVFSYNCLRSIVLLNLSQQMYSAQLRLRGEFQHGEQADAHEAFMLLVSKLLEGCISSRGRSWVTKDIMQDTFQNIFQAKDDEMIRDVDVLDVALWELCIPCSHKRRFLRARTVADREGADWAK